MTDLPAVMRGLLDTWAALLPSGALVVVLVTLALLGARAYCEAKLQD